MKALILFGLVLVVAESVFAENGKDGAVVSMDSGVSMANAVFQEFMENTYNGSCNPCRCKGCCPVIVRNCAPKWVGTVVEGFTGWRGNAAVIVDWGCTEYNPCGCGCPKGRLCTTSDVGFVWSVNWGDGAHNEGYQQHLGPFQITHQYDKSCRSRRYSVTIHYCSDPGVSSERCCDSYYQVITVDENPGKGHAEVDYNKPLLP